jgi:hypothetical protein
MWGQKDVEKGKAAWCWQPAIPQFFCLPFFCRRSLRVEARREGKKMWGKKMKKKEMPLGAGGLFSNFFALLSCRTAVRCF